MTNTNTSRSLWKIYQKLHDNVLRYRSLVDQSVFLTLLDVKSNKRLELLNDSAIPSHVIPKTQRKELLRIGLVKPSDFLLNHLIITGKGILEIERQREILTEEKLFGYVDKKWFTFHQTMESPTEKEKVILLSMLSARVFSPAACMDLKLGDTALNAWKEILDASYRFLAQQEVISKLRPGELYGKKGNEHPVSHLIRHTDVLPKKTKGIFKALGNQKYCVDVCEDDALSEQKLSYLYGLIIGTKVLADLSARTYDFCVDICYEKSVYISSLDGATFARPAMDGIIEKALRKLMFY